MVTVQSKLVLRRMIMDAHGNFEMWDLLYRQVSGLTAMKEKYSKVIDPNKDLPTDYMKALLAFKSSLTRATLSPIENLKRGVPSSPPFRLQYVRAPFTKGDKSDVIKPKGQVGNRQTQILDPGADADYMLYLFSCIWEEKKRFLHGLPNVMDELERLVQSDAKQRVKLSNWVSENFSNLGLISFALHELSIYLPWAASMDDEIEKYKDTFDKEFMEGMKQNVKLYNHRGKLSMAQLGAPTNEKFEYPSDKRRTQQNVNKMRKAEENLDAFWASIDRQYQKLVGVTLHDAFKNLFSEERQIERTPEWVEPSKRPSRKPNPEVMDGLHSNFEHLNLPAGDRISKPTFEVPKEKSKTRGFPSSDTVEVELTPAEDPSAEKVDTLPKFTVNKKVYKVFSTMFHTIETADHPGEIAWTDFVNAMIAIGFRPRKLYGSVWHFMPTTIALDRSIQFHEPHPSPKIAFRKARWMGSRLHRVYGWHGGMFEVL